MSVHECLRVAKFGGVRVRFALPRSPPRIRWTATFPGSLARPAHAYHQKQRFQAQAIKNTRFFNDFKHKPSKHKVFNDFKHKPSNTQCFSTISSTNHQKHKVFQRFQAQTIKNTTLSNDFNHKPSKTLCFLMTFSINATKHNVFLCFNACPHPSQPPAIPDPGCGVEGRGGTLPRSPFPRWVEPGKESSL